MPRIVALLLLAVIPCLNGCIFWGRGMFVFIPEYDYPPAAGPGWMNQLGPNPPKPQLMFKGHYYSFVDQEFKENDELKKRAPFQNPLRIFRQKKEDDESSDE